MKKILDICKSTFNQSTIRSLLSRKWLLQTIMSVVEKMLIVEFQQENSSVESLINKMKIFESRLDRNALINQRTYFKGTRSLKYSIRILAWLIFYEMKQSTQTQHKKLSNFDYHLWINCTNFVNKWNLHEVSSQWNLY